MIETSLPSWPAQLRRPILSANSKNLTSRLHMCTASRSSALSFLVVILLAQSTASHSCRETYGPFTRNYHRPNGAITDEDARIMARQGHSFVTADEVRVVYQHREGEPFDAPLRDVPADGRTLGEVVVRGNIVMKEVRSFVSCRMAFAASQGASSSYLAAVLPRSRSNEECISRGIFWLG